MRPPLRGWKDGRKKMLYKGEILEDEQAKEIIEELYHKGHNMADRVIEQVLGGQLGREEREDLIQEGFLRMIVHVEALKDRSLGERLSYMCSAMRNIAIDEGRRLTKIRRLGCIELSDSPEYMQALSQELTPEEQYLAKEETMAKCGRLRAALARLSLKEQAVLTAKYILGMNDREIGQELGIGSRSVSVYLTRARKKAALYYMQEPEG